MGTILASTAGAGISGYSRNRLRGFFPNSLNSNQVSSCSCSTAFGAIFLCIFGLATCYCIKREAIWAKLGVLSFTVVSVLILFVPFGKKTAKLNGIAKVQCRCPPETKHVVTPIGSYTKKTENSPSHNLTIGTPTTLSSFPSYENISVVS